MSDVVIETELAAPGGRYVIRKDGEEAELTFSIKSPKLRIALHTGVPDSFRGTGAGRALVEKLVEDARAEGFKVVPRCPFVDAMRRRYPDWADAFFP